MIRRELKPHIKGQIDVFSCDPQSTVRYQRDLSLSGEPIHIPLLNWGCWIVELKHVDLSWARFTASTRRAWIYPETQLIIKTLSPLYYGPITIQGEVTVERTDPSWHALQKTGWTFQRQERSLTVTPTSSHQSLSLDQISALDLQIHLEKEPESPEKPPSPSLSGNAETPPHPPLRTSSLIAHESISANQPWSFEFSISPTSDALRIHLEVTADEKNIAPLSHQTDWFHVTEHPLSFKIWWFLGLELMQKS